MSAGTASGPRAGAPALSVAVVVGSLRKRAQRTIDAVGAQDVAGQIELLVVDTAASGAEPLRPPSGVRARVLAEPGAEMAHARGEAVRRAEAPVVAFLEDHAIPQDDWAQAVIGAASEGWAAIGYAFTNANPQTWASRGALMADYAPWAHPARRGPAARLSGNNVAYDRDALVALGARLDGLLVVDFNLQAELAAGGGGLFLESRALVAHENFDRVSHLCAANHAYCRLMAIERARSWHAPRRALYAAAALPVVPVLKLARLAAGLRGRRPLWPRVLASLPVILATYCSSAAGEARGYLERDPEQAGRRFTRWELESERS
jgi:hypothetical protein